MMSSISKESFKKIDPLIISGRNYVQLYGQLKLKLDADESELFSKIEINGNGGEWFAEGTGYRAYKDASPVEKELIACCIEEKKDAIIDKMKGEMPFIEKLLRVPSEGQIFWRKDENDEVHVALAQWGFKQVSQPEDVDIINYILEQPRPLTQQQVILHADYSNGQPAANLQLTLTIFNHSKPIRTNDEGNYPIGNMYAGKKFSVNDSHDKKYDYTVASGKDLYTAIFDLYTNYTVKVVNQDSEPKVGYPITVDGETVVTDEKGKYEKKDVILHSQHKIIVSAGETQCAFALAADPKKNQFEIVVEDPKTGYVLMVRNQYHQFKPNYPVRIDGEEMTTDNTGRIVVNELPCQEVSEITVSVQGNNPKTFRLSKNAAENVFEYEVKDPVTGYVLVVKNQQNQIKPNYNIYIDGKEVTTDNNGQVVVNELPDPGIKEITVSAQGNNPKTFALSEKAAENVFEYVVQDPGPKKVKFKILDYKGRPVPFQEVFIKRKRGDLKAVTDSEGYIYLPAEDFKDKEKLKVKFVVTKDYQKNHPIK